MLRDAGSRLVFIPTEYRNHNYVAMIDRVVRTLDAPPEVVVLRGDAGSHTSYADLLASGTCRLWSPMRFALWRIGAAVAHPKRCSTI